MVVGIEEQLQEIEARIGQLNIMIAGCTERAELAATRAEEAAMRAELATQQSQQAELVATLAAATATTSAAIAVEQEEEIEETIQEAEEEVEEDASESLPNEGGSTPEREATESKDLLDRGNETEEPGESPVQPIVIQIKNSSPKQSSFFKPNRTTFNRGRKS